ncbi:ABC transporter permease [Halothermothrix orenii]|uniref:Binding-protein-dependent transport systems inner membrane component n=1 Tax=Halothermothrix orenii (strain H 168 / OCM 544 / DSM 9562) TaxID=373903 RepID=B8CY55_HALOH|nr:ABC transporter permease [Halothermothrix orenii]ACL70224.1 binding-protein-dependent transport systems inner membrane component [Halothermothrix orenii H 168]
MKLLRYLLVIVVLFIIWYMASILLNSPVLPSPFEVVSVLVKQRSILLTHLGVSLYRVGYGLLFGLLTGVPVGLLLGRNKELDKVLSPVIYLGYPVPKIAFLPLVLLFLGLGNMSKIFLIAFIVFFQIVVTTRDAAKNIDPELIISVKSLGAGSMQIYREVIIPATFPKIFTATRISIGTAIAVLFLTETFATFRGLGYFIMDCWTRVNYTEMYAGILILSLLGLSLFLLIDLLERIICPWLFIDRGI